jgi:glycosyltransferase involved in cell wall biosynthesis/protein-L-isoaspartate O-methyltransferase
MDSDRKISDSTEITDPQVINAFIEKPDNTFLVSFPRTGSHWLRMLMELYFGRPSLVRVFYYPERTDYLTLHTHDIDLDVKRSNVIYLYRDPVDTIYSQLCYYKESPDDLNRIEYWSELYGKHLDKWLHSEKFCTRKTVISYEGLKKDIVDEFGRITRHYDQPLDTNLLEKVVPKVSKIEVKSKTMHDLQVIQVRSDYELDRNKFRALFGSLVWSIVLKDRSYLKNYFDSQSGKLEDRIVSNGENISIQEISGESIYKEAMLSTEQSSLESSGISGTGDSKIVGLIAARNEEHFIDQCLRALSVFTDAIVFLDDASDDNTVRIVESLAEECNIERIIRKETWHRDEPGDRNMLLHEGRNIGGTHFIVIDADEIFTSNCLNNDFLHNNILQLRPGDILELNWIQLWRSTSQYRFDGSIWTWNYKDFVFCDDGSCHYDSEFIHTKRTPNNLLGNTNRIEGYDFGVMHFQFVNWRNLLIKQAWYRCLERIRNPKKPISEINDIYALSKDETNLGLRPAPKEWFEGYNFFDKTILNTPDKWRENQVLEWVETYGKEYFDNLDIWDIDWGAGISGNYPIGSNLEFWKKLQEDNYFEKQSEYLRQSWGKERYLNKYGSLDDLRATSENEANHIADFFRLSPDMVAVIIGCGYGRESKFIAQQIRHVYGIDVNNVILEKAEAFLAKNGISNFTAVLADEWQQIIPTNIDFVYSITVFQHITRSLVKDYIVGLSKKLSPGGKFIIQFAESSFGESDAEMKVYEPNVTWNIQQIRNLINECGLICYDILSDKKEDNFFWHWAFFGKEIMDQHFTSKYSYSSNKHISHKTPKVTAVVSTYNSERFIDGCLEDLVNQTLYKKGELEIIVVDSGSQQNERLIVQKFQQQYDNIIYIHSEERETVYAAWNRGVLLAKGAFITNANTDDRHRHDALEVLSKALDENPDILLVYGDCYLSLSSNQTFDENPKNRIFRYPDYFAPACLLHFQFGPQPMWRKIIHEAIGYFDDSYVAIGDYEFNIRFAIHYNALHISEPLGVYLKHDNAISFRDDSALKEMERIITAYRKPEVIKKLYRKIGMPYNSSAEQAKILLDMGLRALDFYLPWEEGLSASDFSFAIQCFMWAASIDPTWNAPFDNLKILFVTLSQHPLPTKLKLISSGLSLPTQKELYRGTNLILQDNSRQLTNAKFSSITNIDDQSNIKNIRKAVEQVEFGKNYRKLNNGNNPKVLFVVHNFLPYWFGGVEIYTYRLAQELAKRGFETSVLYPRITAMASKPIIIEDKYHDIKTYTLLLHDSGSLEGQIENEDIEEVFRELIEKQRFNIVHFHHLQGLPFSFINVAKGHNRALFITLHDFWFICPRTHLYIDRTKELCEGPSSVEKCSKCLLLDSMLNLSSVKEASIYDFVAKRQEYVREIMQQAQIVSSPSKYLSDKFHMFNYMPANMVTSPLGVNTVPKKQRKKDTAEIIFGYIGSIHCLKNAAFLAKAFIKVKGNAKLIFWGNGATAEIAELKIILESDNRMKYKGDYIPEQLPDILSNMDVVIVPSLIESYSFVVREALSAGIPVIASNVGGIPEIISHMKNGILVQANSEEELIKRIQEVIDNPLLIEKLKSGIEPVWDIAEDAAEWIARYKQHLPNQTRIYDAGVSGEKIIVEQLLLDDIRGKETFIKNMLTAMRFFKDDHILINISTTESGMIERTYEDLQPIMTVLRNNDVIVAFERENYIKALEQIIYLEKNKFERKFLSLLDDIRGKETFIKNMLTAMRCFKDDHILINIPITESGTIERTYKTHEDLQSIMTVLRNNDVIVAFERENYIKALEQIIYLEKEKFELKQLPLVVNNPITNVIDLIKQHNGYIEIKGWAYINGQSSENSEISLLFISNSKKYLFKTTSTKRRDVTSHFKTLNYDDSGFSFLVPSHILDNGNYAIFIQIKKGTIETVQFTNSMLNIQH